MDYVLVVKFSGGDYVLDVKFSGGGLCPRCKIHGGDFVHVYKNEQGGFCPGGILSYTRQSQQNKSCLCCHLLKCFWSLFDK